MRIPYLLLLSVAGLLATIQVAIAQPDNTDAGSGPEHTVETMPGTEVRTDRPESNPTPKGPESESQPAATPGQPEVSEPDAPNPAVPNPAVPNPAVPNPAVPNPVTPNPGTPNPGIPGSSPAKQTPPVPGKNVGRGSVSGIVVNEETQTPIAEAAIALVKAGDSHRRAEAKSDALGRFSLTGLEAGKWRLSVAAPGMLAFEQTMVVVNAVDVKVNAELAEIEAADVLRVTGKRTLVHPEKTATSTTVNKQFLDEYKSGNNLNDVVNSAPGIMRDTMGNTITRGEHNAINYELDGVVLPEAGGTLSQSQFSTPRALESVTVDVGGYQAKDGGGPLGAVVRLRSMPIAEKFKATAGGQLGGPLNGTLYYNFSGALSTNPNKLLNKIRIESTGQALGTKLGLEAPTTSFAGNQRANLNFLTKVEFTPTEKDRLRVTVGINESFLRWPTSKLSGQAGVRITENDRENFIIASYRRRGEKHFDEANLHFVNAFYSQRLWSRNTFDPNPILVGEEPFIGSTAANATRFNYVFSAQGDIRKQIRKTHNVTAGFLSEVRPVKTRYSAFYYNADRNLAASSQQEQQAAADTARQDVLNSPLSDEQSASQAAQLQEVRTAASNAVIEASDDPESEEVLAQATAAGDAAATQLQGSLDQTRFNQLSVDAEVAANAAAAAIPVVPYGSLISPYTRTPQGPQFLGNVGNYNGFRYLQSAYIQDVWRPEKYKALKRLTVNAGVRFDLYHGVFGSTMGVAQQMASIPGIAPFSLEPFKRQTVTNAQVSGRFGAAYALTNTTLLRGSFSQIFQPPPVDLFATPPNVSEAPINGIYNGTLRALQATRGLLVDAGIEQQMGSRFVVRNNLYWKKLKNFGDSGVVQNTPLYNRLSLSAQSSYGVETRLELKPGRDGYGFSGFLSSTVAISYLRGSRSVTGGIYEIEDGPVTTHYPDHDRRMQLASGFGYRGKSGLWSYSDLSVLTGLKNSLDPALFGAHPARTPPVTILGLNAGYDIPQEKRTSKVIPSGVEVRMENLLNQRKPLNLGSPYQGTRYMLPIRVLAGVYWKV